MSFRYEIEEETFAVRVFANEDTVPFIFQPDYPDGTAWDSAEEASTWAELAIAALEDENAPYAPISRGVPGEPKPTPEQIAEWEAELQTTPTE